MDTNTETKEEMIEEIVEIEEKNENTKEASTMNNVADSSVVNQSAAVVQPTSVVAAPEINVKKKSKAPALIILFILLILDIAAIVIYIIGVDKVLSFIK